MSQSLRQLYWRLKYRPGRVFSFSDSKDFFNEVLIVENRVASKGTVVYRTRHWDPWFKEPGEESDTPFGPPREDTVQEMIRRARQDDWA